MLYRWKRALALVAVLALAVAACGDDDATTEDTAGATTSTAATSGGDDTDGGEDMAGGDDTDGGEDAPSIMAGATVTVGGEEFVLENQQVCVSMAGAVGAQFASADGLVTFSVDLPPESWDGTGDDWDPASVRLDDDRDDMDNRSWRAGGEVVSGMENIPPEVMVTGFSSDGSTATGTATVVDLYGLMVGEAETAEMTFSIACS